MIEPSTILAISMFSLLALGLLAQFLQSRGGKVARYAPVIVLGLLLIISVLGMLTLSSMLDATEWANMREASKLA